VSENPDPLCKANNSSNPFSENMDGRCIHPTVGLTSVIAGGVPIYLKATGYHVTATNAAVKGKALVGLSIMFVSKGSAVDGGVLGLLFTPEDAEALADMLTRHVTRARIALKEAK